MRRIFRYAMMLGLAMPAGAETKTPPFAEWGRESLEAIKRDLWIEGRGLYAERADFSEERGRLAPSFMWGVGVQLTALVGAAAVEPETYTARARAYADAIEAYWQEHDGVEGYDVLPDPKKSDRYYDDNAWLVLGLAELFEVTEDRKYLDKSEATFRFVMSGEDGKLGGGLYWHENNKDSKNTCTNAPTIVSALRLHQLTKKAEYLEIAERVYAWTRKHLQDEDALYWDAIKLDGEIDRRKFTYNSALMIRANALFYEVTGEKKYLDEAKRMAKAADERWVKESGAIADAGKFAHLLLESFVELHRHDADPRWLEIPRTTMVYVREKLRDANGRYPGRWDREPGGPLERIMLLDQAAAARGYWVAAKVFGERP